MRRRCTITRRHHHTKRLDWNSRGLRKGCRYIQQVKLRGLRTWRAACHPCAGEIRHNAWTLLWHNPTGNRTTGAAGMSWPTNFSIPQSEAIIWDALHTAREAGLISDEKWENICLAMAWIKGDEEWEKAWSVAGSAAVKQETTSR